MDRDITIKSVEQLPDVRASHAVMVALRPHMDDVELFTRQVMRQRKQGYLLDAAWLEGRIVGLIGYRLVENLLHGRFVFVDDLIVREDCRNDGIGTTLLSTARSYAREMRCGNLVLETGLNMALAQRFYFRQGLLTHAVGFAEILLDPKPEGPAS